MFDISIHSVTLHYSGFLHDRDRSEQSLKHTNKVFYYIYLHIYVLYYIIVAVRPLPAPTTVAETTAPSSSYSPCIQLHTLPPATAQAPVTAAAEVTPADKSEKSKFRKRKDKWEEPQKKLSRT